MRTTELTPAVTPLGLGSNPSRPVVLQNSRKIIILSAESRKSNRKVMV